MFYATNILSIRPYHGIMELHVRERWVYFIQPLGKWSNYMYNVFECAYTIVDKLCLGYVHSLCIDIAHSGE